MDNTPQFKRGDKVNYNPDAAAPDPCYCIEVQKYKPVNGSFVWARFAHLHTDVVIIEHPDGHDKSAFTASGNFEDGFESVHSSQLNDGVKYIGVNRWQLELVNKEG
jgi:hypothetical protein